jgi:hypothetical protein
MAQYAKNQPVGFKNKVEKIAIVGVSPTTSFPLTTGLSSQAGGAIGSYVVSALLENGGFIVTTITRPSSKNKVSSGVMNKIIDYDDRAALVAAMQGQDVLIITLAVAAPADAQIKLIDAAAAADVPWVIPNSWGYDATDKTLEKSLMYMAPANAARAYIEEMGKSSWVGIACGFWYEFSLAGSAERYGFNLKKKTLTIFDDAEGRKKIPSSTFPFTGLAVAKLLALKVMPEDENDTTTTISSFCNKTC